MKAHVCSTSSALYVIVCYLSVPIKVQFVKHTTGTLHNIRQRKSCVSFCPCFVLWLEPFTGVSLTSWCYIYMLPPYTRLRPTFTSTCTCMYMYMYICIQVWILDMATQPYTCPVYSWCSSTHCRRCDEKCFDNFCSLWACCNTDGLHSLLVVCHQALLL